MTKDNEIIKAWECCISDINKCNDCPYYETIDGKSYCSGIYTGNVPTNPKCEGNIYNCVKVQYQQIATNKK